MCLMLFFRPDSKQIAMLPILLYSNYYNLKKYIILFIILFVNYIVIQNYIYW